VLAAIVAVTLLGWTASGGFSQGSLKGKVLPVVSTSDVIGYVAPCG
jgi:hypothetical protein